MKIHPVIALASVVWLSVSTLAAQDRTSTGFYYPRSSNIGPYSGFLAQGCNGANDYFSGEFHLGKDSWANLGEPVYAIADGTVIARSLNGWDPNGRTGDSTANINVALMILHKIANGTEFQALYGHIRTTLAVGAQVTAGQTIGTIGDWPQTHVHFAVRISPSGNQKSLPSGAWGRPSCSAWPSAIDGFIDPMAWITSQAPSNSGSSSNPPAQLTLEQFAFKAIRARAAADSRFQSEVSGSTGYDPNWDKNDTGNLIDLRWIDFNFTGGRIVRVYHAYLKNTSSNGYTDFYDPDQNAWTPWTAVQ